MKNILRNAKIDFDFIYKITQKPEEFALGEPLFWNDHHISHQMLKNHLDPNSDGASRNRVEIESTTEKILAIADLSPKSRILDLGCGPGLYATLFEKAGHQVIGIDYSKRSIKYASDYAEKNRLSIKYIYGDYTEVPFEGQFDLVVLIYGDYCVLSPDKRRILLKKIYTCIKQGGFFIFDVSTPVLRSKVDLKNNWSYHDEGFWKASKHVILEQGFKYKNHLSLDQYVVVEENGDTWIYRNWFQDFTKESITQEIKSNSNFEIKEIWGDLKGTDYQADSDWIGLVCQK